MGGKERTAVPSLHRERSGNSRKRRIKSSGPRGNDDLDKQGHIHVGVKTALYHILRVHFFRRSRSFFFCAYVAFHSTMRLATRLTIPYDTVFCELSGEVKTGSRNLLSTP